MGFGHDHGQGLSAGAKHRGRMIIVLALTAVVLIAEVFGAWLSGSLALLADAGHMLTDVVGITLAIVAVTLAQRPANDARTYGYYRLEILAAVINAVLLICVAVFILVEAWDRWQHPHEVAGGIMIVFAAVGLLANLVGLLLLRAGSKESLNVKGAYFEVLGDSFGSAAVLLAALVISVTGWEQADVVASVLVALMILPRAWSLLREVTDVLLEAVPKGTDLSAIRTHILQTPGVVDAHDLHVWTLTSGMPVLSVHVVVDDQVLADNRGGQVLDALGDCLAHHFDVDHCTFQLEPAEHAAHEHTNHH